MRGVTKMQIKSIKTLAQFKYSNSTGNTSVFDINTSIITLNKTTTGTESCNAYHRMCAVNPSDVYEIAVLARKISGANGVLSVTETGGTNGPSALNAYNYVEISSNALQWYKLRTTVRALNAHSPTSPIMLTVLAGYNSLVTGAGSIEILDFHVKQIESFDVAPRIAFTGSIRLNNGAVWVNAGYYKHSIEVDIQSNSIRVTTSPKVAAQAENALPLVVSQEVTNLGLSLKQTASDGLTGVVTFKVYNSANTEVNLSTTIADFNVIAVY